MKKNLLLLMLALLLPAFMYGQEQTVSGTVLDTYNISTVITLSPYPTKTPH